MSVIVGFHSPLHDLIDVAAFVVGGVIFYFVGRWHGRIETMRWGFRHRATGYRFLDEQQRRNGGQLSGEDIQLAFDVNNIERRREIIESWKDQPDGGADPKAGGS